MKSSDKIAIITGGSRGLGRNTAVKLARTGCDVILTYHSNTKEADSAVAEITDLERKAVALRLDAGDVGSFDDFTKTVKGKLSEHWGRDRFDFLVNNAGISLASSFAETTEEAFDQLLNVHFKGVCLLTQKLLPLIADGGRIVNISSGLTRVTLPGYSVYASMKGAIEVLTHYLAKELGPRGIAVKYCCPRCYRNGLREWRCPRQSGREEVCRVRNGAWPCQTTSAR